MAIKTRGGKDIIGALRGKGSTPVILCALLVVLGGFVWWLNTPFIEDIFTVSTITLIMVLGFQLFMGN